MDFSRFTDRCRRVFQYANQEAQRCNHAEVNQWHLLIGMVKDESGVAGQVLTKTFGVTLKDLRDGMEKAFPVKDGTISTAVRPLSPTVEASVENAVRIAADRTDSWVGTEHLLLGMFGCALPSILEWFAARGQPLKKVCDAVHEVLGSGWKSIPPWTVEVAAKLKDYYADEPAAKWGHRPVDMNYHAGNDSDKSQPFKSFTAPVGSTIHAVDASAPAYVLTMPDPHSKLAIAEIQMAWEAAVGKYGPVLVVVASGESLQRIEDTGAWRAMEARIAALERGETTTEHKKKRGKDVEAIREAANLSNVKSLRACYAEIVKDVEQFGVAYVWNVPGFNGGVVESWMLPAQFVIHQPSQAYPTYYVQTTGVVIGENQVDAYIRVGGSGPMLTVINKRTGGILLPEQVGDEVRRQVKVDRAFKVNANGDAFLVESVKEAGKNYAAVAPSDGETLADLGRVDLNKYTLCESCGGHGKHKIGCPVAKNDARQGG